MHVSLCREGANYYWYHRTIVNFENWASCSYDKSSWAPRGPFPPPPPGWELLKTLYYQEPYLPDGGSTFVIPMAIVLKRDSMLIVLFRGMHTPHEWTLDVSFQYTNFEGMKTHSGFTTVADFLFRSLTSVLLGEVVYGRITSVALAGHSFGAGVAAILAPFVQVYICLV